MRPPLDYATPRTRGARRFLPSFYLAVVAIGLTAFLLAFVSPYWGGVPLINQERVVGTYAVWVLSIAFVLQRVREDERWPSFGLALVAAGGVAAAIALPVQLLIWREDAGHPQSRFRLTMWPLACAVVALVIVAIGRGMTRRRTGPGRQ